MLTEQQKELFIKIKNYPHDIISEKMMRYEGNLKVANNLVRKGFLQKISQDNGIIVFKKIG